MFRSVSLALLTLLVAAPGFPQLPLPQGPEFEVHAQGDFQTTRSLSIVADDRSELLAVLGALGEDGRMVSATGRFFGADGVAVSEEVVFEDFRPCATISGIGGLLTEDRVLFVWSNQDFFVSPDCSAGETPAVWGQWYSRQGEPQTDAFRVSTDEEGGKHYPTAAVLSDGSLLVSWAQVGPETGDDEVDPLFFSRQMGRRFSPAGAALGPEMSFSQGSFLESDGGPGLIVPGPAESFLVFWEYFGGESSFGEVAYRSFAFDGTPLSDQQTLGTVEEGFGNQSLSAATRFADGTAAVVWASAFESSSSFEIGVAVQRFDPTGLPLGPRFVQSTTDDLFADLPSAIAAVDGDRLLLTWTRTVSLSPADSEISGRWLDSQLQPLTEPFEVNARFTDSQVVSEALIDPAGGATVLFTSSRVPGTVLGRQLASECTPGPTTLCLGADGRFRVEAAWLDFGDRDGQAGASALTAETGTFWFFRPENIELVAKVVDGALSNGSFWVFYGALSNVEYRLTVTDTGRGLQKVYRNPARNFASVGDTRAFPGDPTPGGFTAAALSLDPACLAALLPDPPSFEGLAAAGTSGDPELEFEGGRFRARIGWRDFAGRFGVGRPVMLTPDTGTFWFFNPDRVEVIVKILDGRPINGNFWVFYGALSNVEYTLIVRDTVRGTARTYTNPLRHFGSVGDTEAFPD